MACTGPAACSTASMHLQLKSSPPPASPRNIVTRKADNVRLLAVARQILLHSLLVSVNRSEIRIWSQTFPCWSSGLQALLTLTGQSLRRSIFLELHSGVQFNARRTARPRMTAAKTIPLISMVHDSVTAARCS